ncbi:uncharacterized protein SPSK_05184 [Sporothrix schenckii 1099-18]|uniref:Cytochrome P450 oxidoreductase n=2 Tax=Sporothrix schenckii TaxID=29908 RepID=U7Q3R7_SPOS1|nr:uncharacterized protein SPSK_05184 [Sporothrix schenckii 1099-18]ERT01837.1 hypothetical protein HMPREF1624_00131 [Sporothrix schenckii ATCC 58251]KJR81028.1 hypothetical protein SPSK_05184 [Sporothrix schenckii 1099-18]
MASQFVTAFPPLPALVSRWPFVLLATVAAVFVILATNYFHHGFHKYPGPRLGAVSDLWRFLSVWRGKPQDDLRALHAKHGDVVRVGPNALSFSHPDAVRDIYGISNKLTKSAFYPVQMQLSRGVVLQSLFGTQDQDYHMRLRRTVTSAFSMTAIRQYEPRVNETVRVFLKQTERLYAGRGSDTGHEVVCNFVQWLQYFAFDVITEITYSRRVGFVDRCEDVDGIIAWLAGIFDYQAPVGQMPWLDRLFVKNPVRTLLSKYGFIDNSSATAKFSRARMAERFAEMEEKVTRAQSGGSGSGSGDDDTAVVDKDSMDLLTMFCRAQKADPAFFDDGRLLTMTTSIALAGSDTTAASLSAVFYHLLKNPRCYTRLVAEIDHAVIADADIVTYAEAQQMPYLHACIQETFRMHPAIGLVLERLTPPQGIEIAGQFVPGGTVVGCNPWVIHARQDVFGDDADVFRPERWMVDKDADPAAEAEEEARIKDMANTLFHFGGGSRTCLGKHIALLEMYKLVPSFLRRFDVQLTTDEDWDLHNAWFVKPKKFDVKIVSRSG